MAYVCQCTPEQVRENRGDLTTPAVSPYRDRPIEESLDLFARMKAGEFEDGSMTLRAKIDLASGNFNMRDPVLYRISHMRIIIVQEISGAFILCMIMPILLKMHWKALHIRCVLWSLKHTDLYTTG